MDLRHEQRKVRIRSAYGGIVCAFVLSLSYFLLPAYFEFPVDLSERLSFAVQASIFILIWIAIGVKMVSGGRLHSAADIKGSAFGTPSAAISVKAAFLQNTLEQSVLACGANLAFATVVSGDQLSLLVGSVLLFGIGRISFYLGYPAGAGARAFGMATTAIPIVLQLFVAVILILKQILG